MEMIVIWIIVVGVPVFAWAAAAFQLSKKQRAINAKRYDRKVLQEKERAEREKDAKLERENAQAEYEKAQLAKLVSESVYRAPATEPEVLPNKPKPSPKADSHGHSGALLAMMLLGVAAISLQQKPLKKNKIKISKDTKDRLRKANEKLKDAKALIHSHQAPTPKPPGGLAVIESHADILRREQEAVARSYLSEVVDKTRHVAQNSEKVLK